MSLAIGQTLRGRNASYCVTKVLTDAVAYQAKIISGGQQPNSTTSPLAVLKLQPQGQDAIMYARERGCYELDGIARSPQFRGLLDLIGHDESEAQIDHTPWPQCMVFEWMDNDLWQLPSEPFRSGSPLPRVVAKSVLEALAVLFDLKGVHTDVNPNNVFVSDADSSQPIVKLGDLGCSCALAGIKTIFGPSDKIIKDMAEEWYLAKIIRLIGPIEPPIKQDYAAEFEMAEYLEKETFVHPETGVRERFIKVGTIREELKKIPGKQIENGCLDFIESLLVLDYTKRPTAREALEHPWIKGSQRRCRLELLGLVKG